MGHSRLWCVYEAHCAMKLRIDTRIAGYPLYLLDKENQEVLERALQRDDAATILSVFTEFVQKRMASTRRRWSILEFIFMPDNIVKTSGSFTINVNDARCSDQGDRLNILSEIRHDIGFINAMIHTQVSKAFEEESGHYERGEVVR